LEIRESEFHATGSGLAEYDFKIEYARGVLRGEAWICAKKSEGRWRMASSTTGMMEMNTLA